MRVQLRLRMFLAIAFGVATVAVLLQGTSVSAVPQTAGRLVFIGTYTGPASKGIYGFRFNDTTGALTPLGLAVETTSPSFITASADGRFVFAVNEVSNYRGERSGSVSSFSVDRATGKLTLINVESSRGADPCHLALDRTGKFLAVANYTGGTFSVLPVSADGHLAPASTVLTRTGSGANKDRQEGPHAHAVVFDARNRFLIGADLGTDRMVSYRFNEATGAVSQASEAVVPPGAGPRHVAFHPTRPLAYGINELSSTVTTFGWDAEQGRLDVRGSVRTLPDGYKGENSTAEIAVHPNGKFVYGSNRGHDSIAVFAIGTNGELQFVEHESTRGQTPRNFALDATGRWLIAANQASGSLAVFSVDAAKGSLSAVGGLTAVGSPVSILFMP